MSSKRKLEIDEDEDLQQLHVSNKKHTLDSDEEDSDEYEKEDLKDSDVEGEEEGITNIQDEVKITPFNMREELEEGHFDKEGHYHWNKDSDVKDNWLDNIDWVKVKSDKSVLDSHENEDSTSPPSVYNEINAYKQIFDFMQPNETVQSTLQRLGKSRLKITTAERLRQKRLGIVDEAGEKITKFTELTNEILTKTGNMDIYQETYSEIQSKLKSQPNAKKDGSDSFDMYSDDFADKEQALLETAKLNDAGGSTEHVEPRKSELQWEFKWKQDDTQLHGPFSTEQMRKWAAENYFKDGVYVRKIGESTSFYSSKRIDFDLYL